MINSYKSGTGILEETPTKYGRLSLSNLGYASVQCNTVPLVMSRLVIKCPYGHLSQMISYGINPISDNN